MKTVKLSAFLSLCLICSIEFNTILAQNTLNNSKIEAIVQLAKFVDWSQNRTFSDNERTLIVLTENADKLNKQNQLKNSSYFKKWNIKYCENLKEIPGGSVIFITNSKKDQVKKVINLSKTEDIITISDNLEYFCSNGGMINLIDQGNQIQFEINYRIIQNKSLEISSKVLALAKIYD